MDQSTIDEYADYIECKEVAFRDIVGNPANHFIYRARMLPSLSEARLNSEVTYTVITRTTWSAQLSTALASYRHSVGLLIGGGMHCASAPGEQRE